jgi:hypothetical protein
MKKLMVVVIALAFIAGAAYAADDNVKKALEPVSTMVTSAGQTVVNAATGTVNTANVVEDNPVTTAVEVTGKAAEDTVKTATFQKVDDKAAKNKWGK